jgi:hypothetical protein
MVNTATVRFAKGSLEYVVVVELGLIIDIGVGTPTWFKFKQFRDIGSILESRGFKVKQIIYKDEKVFKR